MTLSVMKKVAIPAILAATVLVAGMFAFMPVEKASTTHTFTGQTINVQTLQKTLPAAGTDVPFTVTCPQDCLITSIFVDNTPTVGANVDHELVSMTVAGSLHRDGESPFALAGDGSEETRDLLAKISNDSNGQENGIPLNAGQTAVFTFDTANGANDVIITVTVALQGAVGATLT